MAQPIQVEESWYCDMCDNTHFTWICPACQSCNTDHGDLWDHDELTCIAGCGDTFCVETGERV